MKKSKTIKTYVLVEQGRPVLIPVFESYQTVSRRLMDAGDFFEVTTPQGKEIFSKRSVDRVAVADNNPLPEEKPEKETEAPAPHHVPANPVGTTEPQ